MIQKWFSLIGRAVMPAVLLVALVCAGCENPLDPPEQEASGLGTVQLRLANQTPRTLVPNQGPALSYKILAVRLTTSDNTRAAKSEVVHIYKR